MDNLAVSVYGSLVILYGIYNIFVTLAPEGYIKPLPSVINWANLFFTYTCIVLFITPFNLVIGYGLIKRRYWARYGTIAVMLTVAIHALNQTMWWGFSGIQTWENTFQIFFAALTLAYFHRKRVRYLFGEGYRFKAISWHGLLAGGIIIIASLPFITAISFKAYLTLKHDVPLFVSKPHVVSLTRPDEGKFPAFRRIELLNIKILIPESFSIRKVQKPEEDYGWTITLFDATNKQGLMSLSNYWPFERLAAYKGIREATRIDNNFEFEKFILTNNWNPTLETIRLIGKPIGVHRSVREVHISDLKGFLKTWEINKRMIASFSLYSRDDKRFGGGTIALDKEFFSEDDILTIISSAELLSPETRGAENYYKKGMEYYLQDKQISAQFEFVNAYYQEPENPGYIFMLAKSLSEDGVKDYRAIKVLLDTIFDLDHEHVESIKLLKKIEPELSKE